MCLKSTKIRISNCKLSIKIPDTRIEALAEKCLKNQFDFKLYGNFIVLKVPSVSSKSLYTFTVFKKSMLKQCDLETSTQHTNATRILLHEKEDCIQTLQWLLECEKSCILHYQIDNLTATCSLGRKISIQHFLVRNSNLQKVVAYNSEKFQGCFFTFKKSKAVLFRSGIVNILACKSINEVEEVYSWINQITACI